jgi:uncharacterized membrane protein YfcA
LRALNYHEHPHFPTEVRMSWSGIILVIVGALLLANNFDLLPVGWLRQWWPVLLIAIGLVSIVRPQHGRRDSRDGDIERSRGEVDRRP